MKSKYPQTLALKGRNTLDQIKHHGIHDCRRYGISPLQGFIIVFLFRWALPIADRLCPFGAFQFTGKGFLQD